MERGLLLLNANTESVKVMELSDTTALVRRIRKVGNEYEGTLEITSPFMAGSDIIYWHVSKKRSEVVARLRAEVTMISDNIRELSK